MKLSALYDYVNTAAVQNRWIRPKEIKLIASGFQQVKNKATEIRKDIVEGFSYCVEILNEEGTNNTDLTDYIKSLGIGVYSICINKDVLNKEKCKKHKEETEKRLSSILGKEKSGFIIHSITGNAHDYVDFLLYDNELIQLIKQEITDKLNETTFLEL